MKKGAINIIFLLSYFSISFGISTNAFACQNYKIHMAVEKADLIVTGTVTEKKEILIDEVEWRDLNPDWVLTGVSVKPDRVFKGSAADPIFITHEQPGCSGVSQVKINEHRLFFLKASDKGDWYLMKSPFYSIQNPDEDTLNSVERLVSE